MMIRIGLLLGCCLIAAPAVAHENDMGWNYPYECCSNQDCKPIDDIHVRASSEGYIVYGNVIKYGQQRTSPDGRYHVCQRPNGNIPCFFAPPPGS